MLAAVLPLWVALYFWGSNLEIRREGWFTILPPEMEHIRIGILVVAFSTILGIALVLTDFVQWLRQRAKSYD
jgi:hypothetical protein